MAFSSTICRIKKQFCLHTWDSRVRRGFTILSFFVYNYSIYLEKSILFNFHTMSQQNALGLRFSSNRVSQRTPPLGEKAAVIYNALALTAPRCHRAFHSVGAHDGKILPKKNAIVLWLRTKDEMLKNLLWHSDTHEGAAVDGGESPTFTFSKTLEASYQIRLVPKPL